jgi:hypothetical protein
MIVLHSWLRWVVIVLAVVAVGRAIAGWAGRRPWTPADDRVGLLFSIAYDVQFLVGLALYFFLSPVSRMALESGGAMMREPTLRFWGVEHPTMMLAALVCLHVGRVLVRRAAGDTVRHRRAALMFGAATLFMVLGTPWPGTRNARAWIRMP